MEEINKVSLNLKTEKTQLIPRHMEEDHHKSYNANQLSALQEISSKENSSHNLYQQFIWFVSRARFYRIIKRISLSINYQSISLNNPLETITKDPSYFMMNDEANAKSARDDQYNENEKMHLGVYHYIDAFFNGFYFSTNKIWPSALAGLFIHDFIKYAQDPAIRTNDPLWKILLGIAESNDILSSNLGSNNDQELFKYWFGISIILTTPFIIGLTNVAKHYYFNQRYDLTIPKVLDDILINAKNVSFLTPFNHLWHSLHTAKYAILCDSRIPQRIKNRLHISIANIAKKNLLAFDTLADLADFPAQTSDMQKQNDVLINEAQDRPDNSFISRFYANYKLWSLGENTPEKYKYIFLVVLPIFGLTLYTKAFFTWIFIKKILWLNNNNLPNTITCTNNLESSEFLPEISEMVCSMCGNWPFVYINNINTRQGCVNDLLAAPRSTDLILSSLQQLARFSNATGIDVFDLSNQNWMSWPRSTWQNILNVLPQLTTSLKIFNASLPLNNNSFIDDGKLSDLATLTRQITIKQFDFKNVGASSSLVNSFFNNAYLAFTTYFDLSSNNINNDTFIQISKYLPNATSTLKIANNNITDNAIVMATPYLVNASIVNLDISNTAVSTQISQSIATLIKKGILQVLKFANNNLYGIDLTPFWQATTQNSSLKEIDFFNTSLTDQQLASAAPFLNNTSVTDFYLSNNNYGDIGISLFIAAARNTSINKLDFSFTFITNFGLSKIAQFLPFTQIKELSLNGARITHTGLQQLLNGIINSVLKKLSLRSTFSDDVSAQMIATQLQRPNNTLRSVDLSLNNGITDVGGQVLGNATGNSLVEEIKFDNNKQITSKTATAFANNLKKGHLKIFSAKGCNIDSIGSSAIAENLPGSPLEELYLDQNPLYDNGTVPLALKLITPTANPSDLSSPTLTSSEANELKNAKPNSNITVLSLNEVGFSVTTARTICRTAIKANLKEDKLDVEDNPVDPNQVDLQNCRFNNNLTVSLTNDDYVPQTSNSPLYLPSNSNINTTGQQAILGLSSVFIIIPAALLTLLAIYFIYKTLSPSVDQLAAKSFGLFGKKKKNEEDKEELLQTSEVSTNRDESDQTLVRKESFFHKA